MAAWTPSSNTSNHPPKRRTKANETLRGDAAIAVLLAVVVTAGGWSVSPASGCPSLHSFFLLIVALGQIPFFDGVFDHSLGELPELLRAFGDVLIPA